MTSVSTIRNIQEKNFGKKQQKKLTNPGINLFLYVISGQKFRTDLKNLLLFKR